MGSSSDKDENNEIIEGEISIKDKSFISTILQVLFNINELHNYFNQNEFSKGQYLTNILKELFKTRPSNIIWDEESVKIIKLLTRKYQLQMEKTPGKELIQILMVLKYEEKGILLPNWEKKVINDSLLFNNIGYEKQALNDILDKNRTNFDTLLSNNFFGILLTKRKFQNSNNIMHFYNFYCVYEMNLPAIYFNMVNKRKIMHDENNLPQINLIDCIKEMQETKIQVFNNQPCYTEYYMFNAPNYLIFLLNDEDKNLNQFRGHILFQEFSDFSNVILNTQSNKFQLFAIINSKRYNQKNQEKDGVKWFSDKNELEYNKQYKALIRNGETNNFCYYDDKDEQKKCNLEILDNNYFHHILIFKRINN